MSGIIDSVMEWGQNCEFVARCPKAITPEVRAFCDSLEADRPQFLAIQPTPSAEPACCSQNVLAEVEEGNGSLQAGWSIWQMRNAYLVAERHAVLRTESGLIDITPQFDATCRIAFAATEEMPFSFSMPCSYFPLSAHPLVLRSVELMSLNSELFFRGGFRSREFYRNDRESADCLRRYFSMNNQQDKKRLANSRRVNRKAERQRKRANRR
ncbi:hypothetical protein Fuma_00118 [Fuerstiella marisgermanici]|uniref:Uncharacterized protein n=1 Tax=Fuerstiella marisgermanici TaxID=1891926 RepID=A0A1P8W921_9PLAN|nr:hypothetical protein Fuma_00118 [Fuerstiella marisgermanici]